MLALHVAGATVQHKSPFSDLKVIENLKPLDSIFLAKYVEPFYLRPKNTNEFREKYREVKDSIDIELVSKLLGEFNWRPRSVGAYFAALGDMHELEENIGNLLLRSDVCYAGHDYCLALASFSTRSAINYLGQYLEYYLEQPDLWFNQNSAMAALSYIGSCRDRDLMQPYLASWEKFVSNKPNWNLTAYIKYFSEHMQSLNEFKLEIGN